MKNRAKWVGVGLGLGVGIVTGVGAIRLFEALKPAGLKPSVWGVLLVLAWLPLTIALHELGHVIAGLACGFKFYLFIVGPLRIDKPGPKLRVGWTRLNSTWGGLAGCAPDRFDEGLRVKTMWFAAGGPLFSLLCAALTIPARSWAAGNPNLLFNVILFGAISGMLGVLTLIPLRTGGSVSDGGRVLMLLQNKPEGTRWISMGTLVGISLETRPKEWPVELVEQMGDGEGPDGGSVCLMQHLFHHDAGHEELAREWLKKGMEKAEKNSRALQGVLWMLEAGLEARRDGAAARDYYERALKTGFVRKEDFRLVTAAVLQAEGRREEARAELDKAMEEARKKPASIAAQMQEEIEAMR